MKGKVPIIAASLVLLVTICDYVLGERRISEEAVVF